MMAEQEKDMWGKAKDAADAYAAGWDSFQRRVSGEGGGGSRNAMEPTFAERTRPVMGPSPYGMNVDTLAAHDRWVSMRDENGKPTMYSMPVRVNQVYTNGQWAPAHPDPTIARGYPGDVQLSDGSYIPQDELDARLAAKREALAKARGGQEGGARWRSDPFGTAGSYVKRKAGEYGIDPARIDYATRLTPDEDPAVAQLREDLKPSYYSDNWGY